MLVVYISLVFFSICACVRVQSTIRSGFSNVCVLVITSPPLHYPAQQQQQKNLKKCHVDTCTKWKRDRKKKWRRQRSAARGSAPCSRRDAVWQWHNATRCKRLKKKKEEKEDFRDGTCTVLESIAGFMVSVASCSTKNPCQGRDTSRFFHHALKRSAPEKKKNVIGLAFHSASFKLSHPSSFCSFRAFRTASCLSSVANGAAVSEPRLQPSYLPCTSLFHVFWVIINVTLVPRYQSSCPHRLWCHFAVFILSLDHGVISRDLSFCLRLDRASDLGQGRLAATDRSRCHRDRLFYVVNCGTCT